MMLIMGMETPTPAEGAALVRRAWYRRPARSVWLYLGLAVAFLTAPLTALWLIIPGLALAVIGALLRRRWAFFLGLGLALGVVPYVLLGLAWQVFQAPASLHG